jgi:hypothetical protein
MAFVVSGGVRLAAGAGRAAAGVARTVGRAGASAGRAVGRTAGKAGRGVSKVSKKGFRLNPRSSAERIKKVRDFKQKVSNFKENKGRNPGSQTKSKTPDQKGKTLKKRDPVQTQNRRELKQKLRNSQENYREEKKRINDNPKYSPEEKQRRIARLREEYNAYQQKKLDNYRSRKRNLAYARRGYGYNYGYGVLGGLAVGGLAGSLLYSGMYPQQQLLYTGGFPQARSYGTFAATPLPSSFPGPSQMPPSQEPPQPLADTPPMDLEKEPEEALAPFNDQEMRMLAHHNTIAGRCVKSLQKLRGADFVAFLNARDEYMAAKDPEEQRVKGLVFMQISKYLDKRYSTHAMAWGRVMKYRPNYWTREMAQSFADGADAEEMEKIAKMDGKELSNYLHNYDSEKLEEIQQFSQSCAAQTIGCSLAENSLTPEEKKAASKSDPFNQFAVYFQNERKLIEIHLNGYMRFISYVTPEEARKYNIPETVLVHSLNATVKDDIKTKCDNFLLFSNVRMLSRMITLDAKISSDQKNIREIVTAAPPFLTHANELPVLWISTDITLSRYIKLEPKGDVKLPIFASQASQKENKIGAGDLKIINNLVTTITEIVAPYTEVLKKEFPSLLPPTAGKRTSRTPAPSSTQTTAKKPRGQ